MAKSAKKAVKATTTKSGGKSAAKPKKSAAALEETLDEEEREFRAMRVDMPGVQGASAVGIVGIGVGKSPGRNEFFRTHPEFRPIVAIADLEAGMERQYFAVTKEMKEALQNIGITATEHVLYLTVTSRGSVKVIPIRCPDGEGDQNEYVRSKERPNGGHIHVGEAFHRPGEQVLQSLPRAERSFCRSRVARVEAGEDLQTRF